MIPNLVDRSSECLDRISVPKLMQGFEHEITQSHHQNVVGSEDAVRGVLAELLPVLGANTIAGSTTSIHSTRHASRTANSPDGNVRSRNRVGMPKSDPHRQRIENVSQPPSPIHFRGTLQKLSRIRRHLGLKKVGRMQLRQQLDEFVLAWRLLPKTERGLVP